MLYCRLLVIHFKYSSIYITHCLFNQPLGKATLDKEMATHSSILAWRIQGQGSLVGCTESDTNEATYRQQQQVRPQLLPMVYTLSNTVKESSLLVLEFSGSK